LLVGPGVPALPFNKVASQIDLLPTILHFAGLNTRNPMIGKDLMELPESDPGRAIMQYSNNFGYMRGDSLVVLKPYQQPQAFIYNPQTFKLTSTKVNPESVKRALAHSLLPWNLYETKRYHMQ
jgi:phosphoglycerol transferase MdoB-like AlkP superfamily enzyme